MSKLARVLAVGALLTVMSLGSTAHAQDSDAQSQQVGVTQPAPTPDPSPETPPPPPSDPPPPPPVPRAITMKVTPQAGGPGTTVTISADVSGCTQPNSAKGTFGSAARPLTGQTVSSGRFTAHYLVTERDPVGVGRFRVACDNANVGSHTFQVLRVPPPPRLGPVTVAVSPRAGRPGTVVTITAQTPGGCASPLAFFQDRKGWSVDNSARRAGIVASGDRQLVARYTITNNDVGKDHFGVACDPDKPTRRVGYATFQVQPPPPPPTTGGPNPTFGGNQGNQGNQVDYGNGGTVQLPDQIDTGLGGTADGNRHSVLDLVWLLPLAGLLLIAVALGLRLRQTSRRRP
jgi:hypothetical protein